MTPDFGSHNHNPPNIMSKLTMCVQLTQYRSNKARVENPSDFRIQTETTQTMSKPRDTADVLHAVSRHIQSYAQVQMLEASTYKEQFGKPMASAFTETQPIVIRVYYSESGQSSDLAECVMTTDDYTSSAVMKYSINLRKMASGEGLATMKSSLNMTEAFGQRISFQGLGKK